MSEEYRAALRDLARIIKDVAWGDSERVRDLFRYTGDPSVPPLVAELAEQIGTIIVQKEVREFRLESLVEDLFATRKALALARRDPLTGLPNRAMFEELLGKACASALEHGTGLALMLVDLDKFKDVNDTLGHAAGDELLALCAARLRECAGEPGILGRLGGDEFAVLFVDQREDETLRAGEAILESLRRPFALKDGDVSVSASVGVAFRSPDASAPARLLKNADVAMYRAKAEGRNRLWRYRPHAFPNPS